LHDTLRSLALRVPGISTLAATVILSEIGRDMSRFPTAGHLLAWAGLCPGQNESAGKRKSSRLGGPLHQDLGADQSDRRSTEVKAKRLVAQLTKLGVKLELHPLAEAT
jgi:transposase